MVIRVEGVDKDINLSEDDLMLKRMVLFACFMAVLMEGIALAGDPVAGVIKRVNGSASVERDGRLLHAKVGDKIQQGDILITGDKGSMGVIFRDDTSLSMGPETRIVVDEFLFDPAGGKLSFLSKVTKGTAAYLSGKMSRLKPEAVQVETPLAVLGVRGTRFLVAVD